MYNNQLTKLFDVVAYHWLCELYLSDNCLCQLESQHIPRNLKSLRVSNNKLTELCDLSQCCVLRRLDFSGNKLRSLAGERLSACVEMVWVRNNDIREVGDCSHLTCLSRMDLSGNPICLIHPHNRDLRGWQISHLMDEFFITSQGY